MKRMSGVIISMFIVIFTGFILSCDTSGTRDSCGEVTYVSSVPKTGQTTSYEKGDDGDWGKGVAWPVPRFTDNKDGTVTDNLTELIWLKDSNRFDLQTWTDALAACNNLADDGINLTDGSAAGDWRLPNIKEIISLMDYGQTAPSLPSGNPFINSGTYLYWSSNTYNDGASYAFRVNISLGSTAVYEKTDFYYVWPVRGGK